tara:strand:- start:615 stop:821 length:207 start_codon:yes stop_codon:yes gene_type:complete
MYFRLFIRFFSNKNNKIYFVNTPKSVIKYNPPKDNKLIKVQMSESHKPFHYIIDKNDCNLKTINNKKL